MDWITIHDGKVRFDPDSMFYVRSCTCSEDEINDMYDQDVYPYLDKIFEQIKRFSNAGHISLRWFQGECVPLHT